MINMKAWRKGRRGGEENRRGNGEGRGDKKEKKRGGGKWELGRKKEERIGEEILMFRENILNGGRVEV